MRARNALSLSVLALVAPGAPAFAGNADILWRHATTGANVIWKSGSATTYRAVTAVTNGNWEIEGTGDFDHDGMADVLWRNAATGANVIWRGCNASTPTAVAAAPLQWYVAGIGDFDYDMRSDILWRNATTGQNVIWRRGNAATHVVLNSVDPDTDQGGANVAAVADFDGDQYDDILWRSGSRIFIWKRGNPTLTRPFQSPVSGPWYVAGVGDFNGDLRDDFLWRNFQTGANAIWDSANPYSGRVIGAVPLTWNVAGVGDFNNDARADILWRNTVTGQNVIWRSGSAAQATVLATVPDQRWTVAAVADFDAPPPPPPSMPPPNNPPPYGY